MPAPARPNNSGRTLAGRLTRKVGPLPVWAWAALILGLALLYLRLRPVDSAAADTPSPAAAEGTGGAAGSVSPAGPYGDAQQSNDLLSQLYGTNAATIDTLTNTLLTQASLKTDAGAPQGAVSTAGPASSPTVSQPRPPATAASPRGTTQTQSKVLNWDGKAFTTKAGFNAWAKARGYNVNTYLSNKPQAKAIYATLK